MATLLPRPLGLAQTLLLKNGSKVIAKMALLYFYISLKIFFVGAVQNHGLPVLEVCKNKLEN